LSAATWKAAENCDATEYSSAKDFGCYQMEYNKAKDSNNLVVNCSGSNYFDLATWKCETGSVGGSTKQVTFKTDGTTTCDAGTICNNYEYDSSGAFTGFATDVVAGKTVADGTIDQSSDLGKAIGSGYYANKSGMSEAFSCP